MRALENDNRRQKIELESLRCRLGEAVRGEGNVVDRQVMTIAILTKCQLTQQNRLCRQYENEN